MTDIRIVIRLRLRQYRQRSNTLACRRYSMILCSPSPGTSCPDKTISTPCQSLSSETFLLIKYRNCFESSVINTVPGVIQLLSNGSAGTSSPFRSAFFRASSASFADRNRRARCWFIFARGATPTSAPKRDGYHRRPWRIVSLVWFCRRDVRCSWRLPKTSFLLKFDGMDSFRRCGYLVLIRRWRCYNCGWCHSCRGIDCRTWYKQ